MWISIFLEYDLPHDVSSQIVCSTNSYLRVTMLHNMLQQRFPAVCENKTLFQMSAKPQDFIHQSVDFSVQAK